MPTDMPAILDKLVQQRAVVESMLALVDVPAEKARIETATEVKDTAMAKFKKAETRWNFVEGIQQQLLVLDDHIAKLTPDV